MKMRVKNRNGLRLAVVIEGNRQSDKLVFITHGLSGSKDQPHVIGMREAFADAEFTVVSFDTAYSFGESEGDSIKATPTSYIEDLEDIIGWAKEQEWYTAPFYLAGHSLGGLSSLYYAYKHPEDVEAVFPMSTVVSGKLWVKTENPERLKEWEKQGHFHKVSNSLPGKSGKVGWGLAKDIMNYDVLEFAQEIKCPVLLVVGSEDNGTTPEMHKMLLDKLGGTKELHIIEGMEHTPRNQEQIDEMKKSIRDWLQL